MTPWEINGTSMTNCNCNFGCPCQFGVLPSRENCEAAVIYQINTGHYGDIKLDGLRAATIYHWPKAIHEGNGQMQIIIDPSANNAQRSALEAILSGKDTVEMATFWFVYAAMSPTQHPTLFVPIDLTVDMDARVGEATIDGFLHISLKPVPNIVSGEPMRVLIKHPNGFEFDEAEMASGRTNITGGDVRFGLLEGTHGHFAKLQLTGQGVIRDAVAAE